MSEPPPDETSPPKPPRLIESMPGPLMVLFIALGLVALGVSLVFIIRPPRFEEVAVEERRPPGSGTASHDVGELFLTPTPTPPVPPAACPEVAGARAVTGIAGQARIARMLARACGVAGQGVHPDLAAAVGGLRNATIRFAQFRRPGLESSADIGSRTIYLNVKLALQATPFTHVVPILLHEAEHLRAGGEVTAEAELRARTVEVQACREMVPIPDWPRWCKDARALTDLPAEEALRRLRAVGYR